MDFFSQNSSKQYDSTIKEQVQENRDKPKG